MLPDINSARRKKIQKCLARLEREGTITPDAVVEDARNVASPLHDLFEWDDSKAAHEYRLDQARAIIRTVRVVVNIDNAQVTSVRYVRDPRCESNERGYVSTATLRTQMDIARDAMSAEVSRVLASIARMQDVAIALGLGDEVDDLLRSAQEIQERARRSVEVVQQKK